MNSLILQFQNGLTVNNYPLAELLANRQSATVYYYNIENSTKCTLFITLSLHGFVRETFYILMHQTKDWRKTHSIYSITMCEGKTTNGI